MSLDLSQLGITFFPSELPMSLLIDPKAFVVMGISFGPAILNSILVLAILFQSRQQKQQQQQQQGAGGIESLKIWKTRALIVAHILATMTTIALPLTFSQERNVMDMQGHLLFLIVNIVFCHTIIATVPNFKFLVVITNVRKQQLTLRFLLIINLAITVYALYNGIIGAMKKPPEFTGVWLSVSFLTSIEPVVLGLGLFSVRLYQMTRSMVASNSKTIKMVMVVTNFFNLINIVLLIGDGIAIQYLDYVLAAPVTTLFLNLLISNELLSDLFARTLVQSMAKKAMSSSAKKGETGTIMNGQKKSTLK
jgi:hypothetical protein